MYGDFKIHLSKLLKKLVRTGYIRMKGIITSPQSEKL